MTVAEQLSTIRQKDIKCSPILHHFQTACENVSTGELKCPRTMTEKYVSIGDIVGLFCEDCEGYVYNFKSSTQYNSLSIYNKQELKNPTNLPDPSVIAFEICIQNRFKLNKKWRKRYANVDMDNVDHETRTQARQMKMASDAEIADNLSEQRRNKGKRVRYGDIIQLRHMFVGNYIHVNTLETSRKDKNNMMISLLDYNDKNAQFRVVPRYKVKSEGEYVQYLDQVSFESVKSPDHYFHASLPFQIDDVCYGSELNLGVEQGSFTIIRIQSSPSENEPFVRGGQFVQFFHKEMEAYFVAEGLFDDQVTEDVHLRIREVDQLDPRTLRPSTSAITYWQIEDEKNSISGDPLLWQQQFRFRHATTRKYLSIDDSNQVSLTVDVTDPRTVFRLHPATQDVEEVTFESYARIENVISGYWLQAHKDQEYKRKQNEDSGDKMSMSALKWDGGELRKIACTHDMRYDDVYTIQHVKDEQVIIFHFVAGIVPILQAAAKNTKCKEQMSTRDAIRTTHALKELRDFMFVDGKPLKSRQKLLRNLQVVDLLVNIVQYPGDTSQLPEAVFKMLVECYDALYTYMCGNSRKNGLYFAKNLDFLQQQLSNPTDIGLSVVRIVGELIRDNRQIVDRINKTQINELIQQLRSNQNYRYLELLEVLCVCNNIALADNQSYIAQKWLLEDKRGVYITERGQIIHAEPSVLYISTDSASTWIPLHRFIDESSDIYNNEKSLFFYKQLDLFKALAHGRNGYCTNIITKELGYLTWEEAFLSVQSEILPDKMRAKFCDLVVGLFVDVGNNFSVVDYPLQCFVYEYIGTKDMDKQVDQYAGKELVTIFPALRDWINEFLDANKCMVASQIPHNMLVQQVLRVLQYLVKFGYYGDIEDVQKLLKPLVSLLDGSHDLPIVLDKSKDTKERRKRIQKFQAGERWQESPETEAIVNAKYAALEVLDLLLTFESNARLSVFVEKFKECESNDTENRKGSSVLIPAMFSTFNPSNSSKSAHKKEASMVRELRAMFDSTMYVDINQLASILIDLSRYKYDKMNHLALSILHKLFTARGGTFEMAKDALVLVTSESCSLQRDISRQIPQLRMMAKSKWSTSQIDRMLPVISNLTTMCHLSKIPEEPHAINQRMLAANNVLDIVFDILTVEQDSEASEESSNRQKFIVQIIHLLKAMMLDYPEVQKEVFSNIENLLRLNISGSEVALMLKQIFVNNQELCMKITPKQLQKFINMASEHQEKAPEFLLLITSIIKVEGLNLPLKRNQTLAMKYIMQNYSKIAYILEQPQEIRDQVLLCEMGEDHMQYYVSLVDLLSTCLEGENRYIESLCQTILSLEEIFHVLNNPEIENYMKAPFLRYLIFAYIRTASDPLDIMLNRDLWNFLELILQEIGFLLDFLDTAKDETIQNLLINKYPKNLKEHDKCNACTVSLSDINRPAKQNENNEQFRLKEDEFKAHSLLHFIFEAFLPFMEMFSCKIYQSDSCDTDDDVEVFDSIVLAIVDMCEIIAPITTHVMKLRQIIACLTHCIPKSNHEPSVMERGVNEIGKASPSENPIVQIKTANEEYYIGENILNEKFKTFAKNCKELYVGKNSVETQLKHKGSKREYTNLDADDALPLGDEFQNHIKCFIMNSAKTTDLKYQLVEVLIRELEISAKKVNVKMAPARAEANSMKQTGDLDISCLKLLRAMIHNEERKLPADWETRTSEYRIKKGLKFIEEIQNTYNIYSVSQVILCQLANPNEAIVKEVLALQSIVLFNANKSVQKSVLQYFLVSKEEIFFYAVRNRLQNAIAGIKEKRLIANQKKARERELAEQDGFMSTTMTLSVKALKEIQLFESKMKLQMASEQLEKMAEEKQLKSFTTNEESSIVSKINSKKNSLFKRKKVAFSNTAIDEISNSPPNNLVNSTAPEVVVVDHPNEPKSGNGSQDIKSNDDGCIGLVLKVLARICDGQHQGLQDYLREQPDNLKSFNLVAEVTQLIDIIYSNVTPDNIDLLAELFITLNEFCAGNQDNRFSVYDNKIVDYVNYILRCADFTGCNSLQVVNLWEGIGTLVFSLIEENDPEAVSLALQIRETLDIEAVQRHMQECFVRHQGESMIPTDFTVVPIETEKIKLKYDGGVHKSEQKELKERFSSSGFIYFMIFTRMVDLHTESTSKKIIPNEDYERSLKFYRKNSMSIEILKGEYLQKVYFRVKDQNLLREEIRERLKWGVDRSSPSNKIRDFMDWSRSVLLDIRLQKTMAKNPLAFVLTKGWHLWNYLVIILSFAINVLMLVGYQAPIEGAQSDTYSINKTINPNFYKPAPMWQPSYRKFAKWMSFIGYAHNVFALFTLICFLIANQPKPPNLRYYFLLLRMKLSKDFEIDEAEFADQDAKMVTYMFSFTNLYYFVFFGLSLAGHWHSHYWYAFHLLNIVNNNHLLQGVIQAVTQNGRSLVWVGILGVVIIYIYAIVAFAYFRTGFAPSSYMYCDTLWHCFVTVLRFGLLGDLFGSMVPLAEERSFGRYALMLVYHITFFIFITTIGLNIIFGIIVDTFSELRDLKWATESDMRETCFICSRSSYDFEHCGVGFDHHVRNEHNMWAYIFFFIYLEDTKSNDYTALDLYVATLLKQNKYDFFPLNQAICLATKDEDPTETKLNDLLRNVEELVRHQKAQDTERKRCEETMRQKKWQKRFKGHQSTESIDRDEISAGNISTVGAPSSLKPTSKSEERNQPPSYHSGSEDSDYEVTLDATAQTTGVEFSISGLSTDYGESTPLPPPPNESEGSVGQEMRYPSQDPLDFFDDYLIKPPSPPDPRRK